jgi:Na+(H+)/acetate symporter ActP
MLLVLQGAMLLMLIVLERVGAPIAFIEWATLFTLWLGICVAGFFGATMRPSSFFAAGQNVGNMSLAAAFFIMAMICFIPAKDKYFTLNFMSIIAVALALAAYNFVCLPRLRRMGSYTLTGFMWERFTYRVPAICICASIFVTLSFMALACLTLTINSLTDSFGLSFDASLAFTALAATLSVFVGGLRSILSAMLVMYAAIFIGFVAVGGAAYFNYSTLVLDGFLSPEMLSQLQKRAQDFALADQFKLFAPFNSRGDFTNTIGILFGLIGLMPALGLFNAHKSQKHIKHSFILTLVCLCIAMVAINMASIGALLNPDAQKADLFGKAGSVLGLPLALSLLYQLIPALIGLGGLCLSLFGLSTILGHDIFYKRIMPKSVASWRLAVMRIFWVFSFMLVADIFQIFESEATFLLHISLGLAASLIAPVLLFSFLPRTSSVTAMMILAAGASAAIIMMFIAPDAPLSAGFAGFAAACFIGAAGLASCPPFEPEHAFAQRLSINSDEPLIMHQGT